METVTWPGARHPGVLVTYTPAENNPVLLEIDREVVPLVQAMWARGIETQFCCQGNKRCTIKSRLGLGYVMTSRETFSNLLALLNVSADFLLQPIRRPFKKQRRSTFKSLSQLVMLRNREHGLILFYEKDYPTIRFRNSDIPMLTKVLQEGIKPVWEETTVSPKLHN